MYIVKPEFLGQEEDDKACRLSKSLYELKQNLRAWFGNFNQALWNEEKKIRPLCVLSTI